MTTPNRGLMNQVENTLQPGVAFNWLADIFDRRFGPLTIDFASDANLTLTQVQSDYGMVLFTDTGPVLTTGRDVVFPANFPMLFVVNSTAETLTLKKTGETGITLAAGLAITVVAGPDDVLEASTSTAGASTTQASECISGLIVTPSDGDYKIVVKAPHGGTITEMTTISASGTCTLTGKINTTAFGGTANSVSSSEQSQVQASANVFVAGDDIVLTVSGNSSCSKMTFTIKYTRTLS